MQVLMRLTQGRWSAAGLTFFSLCADFVDVRPTNALQRACVQFRVQSLPGVRPAMPLNARSEHYFAVSVLVWLGETYEM